MTKPVLAYWDIRGLAQPIRLMLAYAGTEFEDKYYVVTGEAPNWDRSAWINEKNTLGLDFPNLPYFMDGDIKLTQSSAIMRYIAGKHDLLGKTPAERAMVDMFEAEICEFRMGFVRLCYMTYNDAKDDYKANVLPQKFANFSKFLEKNGNKWISGENLSFVDFILFEVLDQHLIFDPNCLDKFQNLKEYRDRFMAFPAIKAYLDSPGCIKKRLNNRMAKFGNGI